MLALDDPLEVGMDNSREIGGVSDLKTEDAYKNRTNRVAVDLLGHVEMCNLMFL